MYRVHWAKTLGNRDLKSADDIVLKTLEIIEYFQPKFWCIESPRHGMLKDRPFMKGIPFVDIEFCQFSKWGYQKPTRIWGHHLLGKLSNHLCDMNTSPNLINRGDGRLGHRQVLGGKCVQFSTRLKGRVPRALIHYLLSAIPEITGVYLENDTSGDEIEDQENRNCECEPGMIAVAQRMLQKSDVYRIGKIRHVGKKMELTLLVEVELPDGKFQIIKMLVDTGAEANLVRRGLLPTHLFKQASERLTFVAANGQRLGGGNRTIDLELFFEQWEKELLGV